MNAMIIYAILFAAGFIEEFVAIVYYGFIRKGWKVPCAIMSMIRNIIWIVAGAGIMVSFFEGNTFQEKINTALIRGAVHTLGIGFGNYLSLAVEPFIHNRLLKLQNKGRRKKRWVLLERK